MLSLSAPLSLSLSLSFSLSLSRTLSLLLYRREALLKWKQGLGPEATYGKLISAFEAAGHKDYADTVRKLFQ